MASQKWLAVLQDDCPSTRASEVNARGGSGIWRRSPSGVPRCQCI